METIRRKLFALLGGILLIALFSGVSLFLGREKREGIVVSGKDCEGEILAEILAQYIEQRLAIPVKRSARVDGTFLTFEALKGKEIDLYVEYTGTALTAILGEEVQGRSCIEIYEAVKKGLLKWDIQVLSPLGFQNRYALIMDPAVAKAHGIETLSDLRLKGGNLRVGFDQEFCGREEFEILKRDYNLSFPRLQMMDHVLLYLALERKGCDLINGYSTDGFCRNLKLLEDDQGKLPSYEAVPIIRREVLERYENLEEVINQLAGTISSEAMQEMNYQVEKKGVSIYNAAKTFLENHL
ncbi:MAG: glycine/betaine ABC transporter substrate-binding protein [Chlamydiia bacterium]|nr:glycine/betaine ABC transporter substrate-binding protein [Chlamydiia bacterium]